jgi:long-chain acyl-CoA synthetase
MQNLLEQVRHWMVYKPNDVMVYEGEQTFTYTDIYNRALRFAGGLKRLGLEKGARIGVLMFNHYRWYDLYYGLSAAGCILVPLNYRLANPELEYQINDSGCKMMIFDPEFHPVVEAIKANLKSVEHFVHTGSEAPFPNAVPYDTLLDAEPYEAEVTEEDLFGIYYTGGTTGLAKGVMLSQKSILANAFQLCTHIHLKSGHIALHAAPMFHLADGASNFAVTLVGGSHVSVKAFEPLAVLKAIEKYKTSCALLVPTMINMLINHPEVGKFDLSSLKLIWYGASPIAPDLLQKAMKIFQCDFCQLYGMTEAGPVVTVLMPEDHHFEAGDPASMKKLRAAGRPIIGIRMKVVKQDGQEVKPGEVGEVWARGDNIMNGYWAKPVETEEVLGKNGWYQTRDLAEMDEEGYIYIVDRAKDMIISGGENIYTVEVEAALYKHPAVLEAAVIGVPDVRWGEAVKACVVLKPGMTATEPEMMEFCKQHIAAYKCPKSVDFIEAIPKSGAGKMLKRELREKYWQGQARGVA